MYIVTDEEEEGCEEVQKSDIPADGQRQAGAAAGIPAKREKREQT